jgi:hypothetical protein
MYIMNVQQIKETVAKANLTDFFARDLTTRRHEVAATITLQ